MNRRIFGVTMPDGALQRSDRSGFKGGSLHEAMQRTPQDYFAIFDVDYVPGRDFLRLCMRPFFAKPDWAFVQATREPPHSFRETIRLGEE